MSSRWEKAAEAYATGEHRSGKDLELVVEFAAPTGAERVLDIGAGAGHTALALAPLVRSVVVTDPVDGMLSAARGLFAKSGLSNAEFLTAVAERLPFPDGRFDIVTTRLAAHHFDDVPRAMSEVARVLKPGGLLIFIDTMAPTDPEAARWQDDVERLRDATHKRIYTRKQWVDLVESAGFTVERIEVVQKAHEFDPWVERGGQDVATMARVRQAFLEAPTSAVDSLDIRIDNGRVLSFADGKLVIAARPKIFG